MNIEKFCNEYNLGNVLNITKLTGGLMHKMFKVETDKKTYCIKVLNLEVMKRKEAYDNFILSEKISNYAKEKGIPVSNAITINNNFINKFEDYYYMVFDFVNGKTLYDDKITVEHCKKIGKILANIHNLDYKKINLEPNIVEYRKLYDWESYINNSNFDKMSYKKIYLENYKKYNSMLKRANERFNNSNINQTICHNDMDPKNVMWNDDNPIIIDWECAGVANPERELLEDALCWSGFLSNNFNEEKFVAIFKEYFKYRKIQNVDWYDVICGNLVGRFGWLKYNLERSLGIVSNDEEEMKLAENEVIKTIDEINRYLDLIGDMYDIITKLIINETENYDNIMKQIVESNDILKEQKFKLINVGFTNTIYSSNDYIIRICTNLKNEERFKHEIDFYNQNKDIKGIPKLYYSDITKNIVPYFYEIQEKINGNTLYEIWYKLNDDERKQLVIKIVEIIRQFHLKEQNEYDFAKEMKNEIVNLKDKCDLDESLFNDLINICQKYFKQNRFGIIHGDLHFDNFIYDKDNLYLLDFERYKVAPIDYDFKIFSKCTTLPYLWASVKTDMQAVESDYENLIDMFLENYKELSEIPNIKERLEFYSLLESLNNYKNTKNPDRMEEVNEIVKRIK